MFGEDCDRICEFLEDLAGEARDRRDCELVCESPVLRVADELRVPFKPADRGDAPEVIWLKAFILSPIKPS